ncbi:MAG: response regulator [Bacteroidetes bacterium]|nr:response regulator [Bacteroidota bacterium]
MIKAVLIDDEPLARSIVKEYLQTYAEISIVEECNNGFEGVKAIQQHHPDLIFLDIQMPKINGFEMLELVEQAPAVIFTTAFDEYAMKAFETHAVDYLLKPFSKERFDKAMQKWLTNSSGAKSENAVKSINETTGKHAEEQNRIVVKNGTNIKIIPVQDVVYIEAYDDYVKIFTKEGHHLKKKTMSHFETVLDATDFLRVHRSYIVQLAQITRIEPFEKNNHLALLKSGAKIPLSRSGYGKLKAVLGL